MDSLQQTWTLIVSPEHNRRATIFRRIIMHHHRMILAPVLVYRGEKQIPTEVMTTRAFRAVNTCNELNERIVFSQDTRESESILELPVIQTNVDKDQLTQHFQPFSNLDVSTA
jgi:hypothetical protein